MKQLILLALGVIVFSGAVRRTDGDPLKQPNVIFIKTDDQRFDSLSMMGHPVTQTPNIDRLANEGVFHSCCR